MGIDLSVYIYAGLGAFLHWVLLRNGGLMQGALDQFVDDLADAGKFRTIVKLCIFVVAGAFVSVLLISPSTSRQAFSAGLAWTTLLNGLPRSAGRGSQAAKRKANG